MRFLVIDDEGPSRRELEYLLKKECPDAIVDQGNSSLKAIELASKNDYTAAFLDIHLGDMEGTKLTPTLNKLQPSMLIVFATAYSEYALRAFELNAVDYLVKPFDPERVKQTIEKIQLLQKLNDKPYTKSEKEQNGPLVDKLAVAVDKTIVMLPINQIIYIESADKECLIHTTEGEYISDEPLYYFEARLKPHFFFRTHRSFLVNLRYVGAMQPWYNGTFCLSLQGVSNHRIPVSRQQLKPLREALGI